MEITLTQIALILSFIVTFISSIEFLIKRLNRQVNNALNPIKESIKELDISQCKNFLVNFLCNVENHNKIDGIQIQRAYEVYDHYTNDLKQNSYIHDRWDKLIGGQNEK